MSNSSSPDTKRPHDQIAAVSGDAEYRYEALSPGAGSPRMKGRFPAWLVCRVLGHMGVLREDWGITYTWKWNECLRCGKRLDFGS